MPLDFVYARYNDTYDMNVFGDSQDLLEKVRTGKGDEEIYTGFRVLYVSNFFGGTLSRTRVE